MEYVIELGKQDAVDWNAAGTDRIVQNVMNLCRLFRYEVPYARLIGLDKGLLHKPAPVIESELTAAIADMVNRYEPRAKVKKIEYYGINETGDLAFRMVIDV